MTACILYLICFLCFSSFLIGFLFSLLSLNLSIKGMTTKKKGDKRKFNNKSDNCSSKMLSLLFFSFLFSFLLLLLYISIVF